MPGTIPRPFDLKSQGAPSVGADIIDALVWANNAYGGTTDVQSVAGAARGAGLLFNPAGSGTSVLIYGLQISASAQANSRVGFVTSVPAGYVTTGTSITPKHIQTTLAAPASVLYQNTAALALAAGTVFKAQIITQSPLQYFAGMANTVLRPGSGIVILVDGPVAAYTYAVTYDFVEYKVT